MSLTVIWWFLPTLCSRSWEEESSSSTTGPPAASLSIVSSQTARKGQTHWHFGSIFTAGPAKEENQAVASSWRARKAMGLGRQPSCAAAPLVMFCFTYCHLFPLKQQKKPHIKTPQSTRRIPLCAFCKVIPWGPLQAWSPAWKISCRDSWRGSKEPAVKGKTQLEAVETGLQTSWQRQYISQLDFSKPSV